MQTNMLDEEFRINMKGASLLLDKLNAQEKEVAVSWLKRLGNLQSNDMSVKKERNHFLIKLLAVIKQSVYQRIITHEKHSQLTSVDKRKMKEELSKITEKFRTPQLDHFFNTDKEDIEGFMSIWSNDRKTYVAMKPIPGRGALIYMAVAENPEAGWIIPDKS